MAKRTFADRVKESSITTGTGDFLLDGADVGFQTFVSALPVSTVECYYMIVGGSEWEVGSATLTSTPDTLKRATGTVIASSNADALVNFSAGTKRVHNVIPAIWAQYFNSSSDIGAFYPEALGTRSLAIGPDALVESTGSTNLALMGGVIKEGGGSVAIGAGDVWGDATFCWSGNDFHIIGATGDLVDDCIIMGSGITVQGGAFRYDAFGENHTSEDRPGTTDPASYIRSFGSNTAAYIYGAETIATGQRAARGDAQAIRFVAQRDTTDGTADQPLEIWHHGVAAKSIELKDDRTYAVRLSLVARQYAQTGTPDSAMWDGNALVRVASGTATIVGSTMTLRHADAGATWSAQWAVSGRGLRVEVTGEVTHDIHWNGLFELVESG